LHVQQLHYILLLNAAVQFTNLISLTITETGKMKTKWNGKINNWNWINIISVFVVKPLPTLYEEMPCTWR